MVTALALAAVSCGPRDPSFSSHHQFLRAHRGEMESLDDLAMTAGIDSVEVGTGYLMLNGHVAISRSNSEAVLNVAVDSVLGLTSVVQSDLDSLQALMHSAGLLSIYRRSEFTIFVTGGLLDNMNGFVLVRPGMLPPKRGERLLTGATLVTIVNSEGPWFYFGTS